jgi:hypothetical protein
MYKNNMEQIKQAGLVIVYLAIMIMLIKIIL